MTESIHPKNLLQAIDCPVNERARRWLVVYTKSRQEQALARDLLRLGIPYYLPLVRKISLQRRRVVSQLPLFAGYVFLFGNEDERVRCLATNRVARVLPVRDQETLFNDLRRLADLIGTGMPLIAGRLRPVNSVPLCSTSSSSMNDTVIPRRAEPHDVVCLDLDRGRLAMQFVED